MTQFAGAAHLTLPLRGPLLSPLNGGEGLFTTSYN